MQDRLFIKNTNNIYLDIINAPLYFRDKNLIEVQENLLKPNNLVISEKENIEIKKLINSLKRN